MSSTNGYYTLSPAGRAICIHCGSSCDHHHTTKPFEYVWIECTTCRWSSYGNHKSPEELELAELHQILEEVSNGQKEDSAS